jgi:hypothetical protein
MDRSISGRGRLVKVQVYLKTRREQEIFERVKEALGENDTGTFTYVLKNYAERMNMIAEELHNT